jgi:hypothetical protein
MKNTIINHIKQSPRGIMTKTIYSLLTAIAITVLSLTACTIGEEGDEWMPISSLSQINGEWKGSAATGPVPSGYSGITVTTGYDITMTIYSSAQIREGSLTITKTYSGAEADMVASWGTIKGGLTDFKCNDGDHNATKNIPMSIDIDILDFQGYRINHDDQLKVPAGTFVPDLPEVILKKQ